MRKVFIRTFKILIYSFLIVLAITMNCSFAYAAENGPSDRYGSIYIDDGNDAGYIYYNFNKIYKCKTFSGIKYNKNNNTLYLNNAHIQKEIIINCMGEDFKVEVRGVNHIGFSKNKDN